MSVHSLQFSPVCLPGPERQKKRITEGENYLQRERVYSLPAGQSLHWKALLLGGTGFLKIFDTALRATKHPPDMLCVLIVQLVPLGGKDPDASGDPLKPTLTL